MPRPLNPGETLWSDALVARLSELWLDGITGLEIARQIGVTRSAVMGKLRRIGLLRRERPKLPIRRAARMLLKTPEQVSKPRIKPKKRRNTRPLPPPEPYQAPPPPPLPPVGSFNLLDLRQGHCRWPSGERPDYRFCGAEQNSGSSYCEIHHRLSLSSGSQRDFDRAAEQALAGKLFASRAGVME